MLSKPKRHKNSKESHLQNLYPTSLKQNPKAIRVKFSRYRQNQIFTNVSFDTLIFIGNCDFGVTKKNESSPDKFLRNSQRPVLWYAILLLEDYITD